MTASSALRRSVMSIALPTKPRNSPVVTEPWLSGDDRPADVTVHLREPALEVKRTLLPRGLDDGIGGAVSVVGVDGIQPAEAECGLGRLTRQVVPLPTEKRPRPGRIAHPEHRRRRIGHLVEELLAVVPGLLGLLLKRDVGQRDEHAVGRLARRRERDADQRIDAVVVKGAQHGFSLEARTPFGHGHEHAGEHLPCLLGEDRREGVEQLRLV